MFSNFDFNFDDPVAQPVGWGANHGLSSFVECLIMSNDNFNEPVNPYSQPSQRAKQQMGNPGQQPGLGYVKQINVIAILTMVQGGLLLIMGLFYGGYGVLIGNMEQFLPPEEVEKMQQQEAEFGLQIVFWFMVVVGILVVLVGLMHLIAGYRNLYYRGRIFSVVTWSSGLIGCLTCYCLPTCIGLFVYGLIIFLNPATVRAFKLRESGIPKQEIERQFY